MEIRPLSYSSFDAIVSCFLSAFDDYFVPMPQDPSYYKQRWKKAMVDFNYSFGMYDNNILVGFVIHAIDTRNGKRTAYNTGTGVIPKYRGQHITSQIYKQAIPILKKAGITRGLLEVILDNSKAIRVYEQIGFQIIKQYRCFKGGITYKKTGKVELIQRDVAIIEKQRSEAKARYSWDNQLESLERGAFSYYELLNAGTPESYFVLDKESGSLPQFDVYADSPTAWENLAKGILSLTSTVKTNNIDIKEMNKLKCMETLGIPAVVDQYEMEMLFS